MDWVGASLRGAWMPGNAGAVAQRADGGDPVAEPGSTWVRQGGAHPNRNGFEFRTIPIRQAAFASIIEWALHLADAETGISVLASGEQGVTRAAGGTALPRNGVGAVLGLVANDVDGEETTTAIGGAYHLVMQFSDEDEIKGGDAARRAVPRFRRRAGSGCGSS